MSQISSNAPALPKAGRPTGSGKYTEPTKAIRVPLTLYHIIKDQLTSHPHFQKAHNINIQPKDLSSIFIPTSLFPTKLPLYSNRVQAGFPSPADDHMDNTLDLNAHLIKRPSATFFAKVSGDSMIGVGIHEGDILVVDRSLEPVPGKIVLAILNGELTVKRLHKEGNQIFLAPENPAFPLIEVTEEMDFSIWGVVTSVVHDL